MNTQKKKHEPKWAHRAKYIDHKPKWIDKIPHELWELGSVFFPIPVGLKGYNYPHHKQEYRYKADSEILNAYLETGWNYGISCANNLIVLDIDERKYIETLTTNLPDTIYQITGSREGIHLFYFCDGLDSRKTLYKTVNVENQIMFEGIELISENRKHIGEIKCDPHGYVVGPGSLHPSGNRYGPLKGDKIATVDKDELLEIIDPFINNKTTKNVDTKWLEAEQPERKSIHNLYELTADDVAPWLKPGDRVEHPVHGSSTWNETGGKVGNFMMNDDRETFVCWRCQAGGGGDGCVIAGFQLLAMEGMQKFGNEVKGGDHCCEYTRNNWDGDYTLHYFAWLKAVSEGLIKPWNPPYRVVTGELINRNVITQNDTPDREQYYETKQMLEWIGAKKHPTAFNLQSVQQ